MNEGGQTLRTGPNEGSCCAAPDRYGHVFHVFKISQWSNVLSKSSQFSNLGSYLKVCKHNTGHTKRSVGWRLPAYKLCGDGGLRTSSRLSQAPSRLGNVLTHSRWSRPLPPAVAYFQSGKLALRDLRKKASLHKQLARRNKFSASDPSTGKLWQREENSSNTGTTNPKIMIKMTGISGSLTFIKGKDIKPRNTELRILKLSVTMMASGIRKSFHLCLETHSTEKISPYKYAEGSCVGNTESQK